MGTSVSPNPLFGGGPISFLGHVEFPGLWEPCPHLFPLSSHSFGGPVTERDTAWVQSECSANAAITTQVPRCPGAPGGSAAEMAEVSKQLGTSKSTVGWVGSQCWTPLLTPLPLWCGRVNELPTGCWRVNKTVNEPEVWTVHLWIHWFYFEGHMRELGRKISR